MDITHSFVTGREEAKLAGDHAHYRSQLSSRIRNLRRRLGVATKPREKFPGRYIVTAAAISRDQQFVKLLILTAERAWAHAMSMRELHAGQKGAIPGSARSHIISRLMKATSYAVELLELLLQREESGANDIDILETRAYVASLKGSMNFEKQAWKVCVKSFSEARMIYAALVAATEKELFRNFLADPIDPSLRYAAYRVGIPRSEAVSVIARQYCPDDTELKQAIEKLDPGAFKATGATTRVRTEEAVQKAIVWRSRQIILEDATIGVALAEVDTAMHKLAKDMGNRPDRKPADKALLYDEILNASQDAADAVKMAIDDILREGVNQGDKRVQNLQVARTAINYKLISWRIGRYRILVGPEDGLTSSIPHSKWKCDKEDSIGQALARVRRIVVLYDAVLQSLEAIRELPGVAADQALMDEIEAKHAYFDALKCLALARSHALLAQPMKVLALAMLAKSRSEKASTNLRSDNFDAVVPLNIEISTDSLERLRSRIHAEIQRQQARVELDSFAAIKAQGSSPRYLIDELRSHPILNLDNANLVPHAPAFEPLPVKPLFFDAAWNYLEYPGTGTPKDESRMESVSEGIKELPAQKKGWFGFGR